MLPYLHPFRDKEYDVLTFFPDAEDGDNLHIDAGSLDEPGEVLGKNNNGHRWNILLFKEDETGPVHIDNFEATLGCPLEYISYLIPAGWYGAIVKKTTTSDEIFEEIVESVKSFA